MDPLDLFPRGYEGLDENDANTEGFLGLTMLIQICDIRTQLSYRFELAWEQ